MQNFVENNPEQFQRLGFQACHIGIGDFKALKRDLLAISELEPELVLGGHLKDMAKEMSEMVQNEKTRRQAWRTW